MVQLYDAARNINLEANEHLSDLNGFNYNDAHNNHNLIDV